MPYLAIRQHDAKFVVKWLIFVESPFPGLYHSIQVVRVNAFPNAFKYCFVRLSFEAKYSVKFIGPALFTTLHIQFPATEMGYLLSFGEACLTVAQRFLCILLLRNILNRTRAADGFPSLLLQIPRELADIPYLA